MNCPDCLLTIVRLVKLSEERVAGPRIKYTCPQCGYVWYEKEGR